MLKNFVRILSKFNNVLSIDEIKRLWLFLDSNKNVISLPIKSAIKILLLTGVRTTELRLATWDEFDFHRSLWTIPDDHCKSGEGTQLHLSVQVITILQELKNQSNEGYAIYDNTYDKTLSAVALCNAVTSIQDPVGIPHWTANDLRRSFSAHLRETLKIDPVVVEKCLGRKLPRSMATYNINGMLHERLEALSKWGAFIDAVISGSKTTQIIQQ